MATINDGGSFHPFDEKNDDGTHHCSHPGMSLRDWFAGQFLAGAASSPEPLDVSTAADQHDIDVALKDHWSAVARCAYIAADAMLATRKTEGA